MEYQSEEEDEDDGAVTTLRQSDESAKRSIQHKACLTNSDF